MDTFLIDDGLITSPTFVPQYFARTIDEVSQNTSFGLHYLVNREMPIAQGLV